MDLSLIVSGFANTGLDRPTSPSAEIQVKESHINHIASPPSSDDESFSAEPESPISSHDCCTESVAKHALLSRTLALGDLNTAKLQGAISTACIDGINTAARSAAHQINTQPTDIPHMLGTPIEPASKPDTPSMIKSVAMLSPIQHLHSPAFSEVESMESLSQNGTSLQATAGAHCAASLLTSLPVGTGARDAAHRHSFTTGSTQVTMDKLSLNLGYLEKHQRVASLPYTMLSTGLPTQPATSQPVSLPAPMSLPVLANQPYQIYHVAIPSGYPIPLPSPMMPRISQMPVEMSQAAYDAANTLCYQRTHPVVSCSPTGNHAQNFPSPMLAEASPAVQPIQATQITKHNTSTSNNTAVILADAQQPTRKDLSDVEAQRRGLRVHSCKTCGRSFGRKSGLIRHERIHLGIRPNVCQICKKSFLQRSALTVHLRVHTGEKPYSCQMCHRQFSDSSSLARHRRIHLRDGTANDSRVVLDARSAPQIKASSGPFRY